MGILSRPDALLFFNDLMILRTWVGVMKLRESDFGVIFRSLDFEVTEIA